jgi:SAM-dependent methyltransferase
MENLPLLGPAAPEEGWVPAPRYLLRRRRILRQLQNLPPSEVIEIGCGAGMLLQELSARGFHCHALESSPQARQLVTRLSGKTGQKIAVHDEADASWRGRFPLVMAFEVLEHIEDDAAAMKLWASWLAPRGILLISVPAHPRLWSAADEWAGHYRRYRKQDLIDVVTGAGLKVEHVECYGFPLGNLTEQMQARGIRRRLPETGLDPDHRINSNRSGVERDHVLRWYPAMRSLPGQLALRCALATQAMSSGLPFGNGYLIRARAG